MHSLVLDALVLAALQSLVFASWSGMNQHDRRDRVTARVISTLFVLAIVLVASSWWLSP